MSVSSATRRKQRLRAAGGLLPMSNALLVEPCLRTPLSPLLGSRRDSQRTERVLAGSPGDARLRRPKSPVRSFSRLATNHPGTQTRTAEARPKGIHIPHWPLIPQFRRQTPIPTPASPMARPAPEIRLCHFLKQKKTNNLLASFVQNAHPARRPPVHNSAQLCTLPPKPLGAAIE